MQIKGSNRISKIVTSSNSPPPPSTVTQPKLFLFCRLAFIALPKKKNPKKQQLQAENLPPTLRLYSKPFYTLCSVWTWVWVSAWPVSVCVGVCVWPAPGALMWPSGECAACCDAQRCPCDELHVVSERNETTELSINQTQVGFFYVGNWGGQLRLTEASHLN